MEKAIYIGTDDFTEIVNGESKEIWENLKYNDVTHFF